MKNIVIGFQILLICVFALFFTICKSTPATVVSDSADSVTTSGITADNAAGVALNFDSAITEAARQIENALNEKTVVAILNIRTGSEAVADLIIEELVGALVNGRKLVVTERKNLDTVRKEMNLQLSGEVSDESLQAIGQVLGAEYIISGTFTDLGSSYRLRVQAVNVSSARIEAQYSAAVAADLQIAYLIEQEKAATQRISAASPIPAAREPTEKRGSTYRIGDWGPAGGIIFYDKGNDSDGWRYLEAAPKELEVLLEWFPDEWISRDDVNKLISASSTVIGAGRANSKSMLAFLKQHTEKYADIDPNDYAVLYCESIDFESFTDWYLPSIDELELIEKNLWKNGLGEFMYRGGYWSSSLTGEIGQFNSIKVWVYGFLGDASRRMDGYFHNSWYVRPIRAFK
ncbi:MAG: hypothetical protein LBU66_07425 [Treponema sp.]|jgi:curli biogenesis system outer membrane secretion channel CsgG|nr:hypothetical protein [Treponema sp.]